MKQIDYKHESGLRVVIYTTESGKPAFKTYFNTIPVNMSFYEFDEGFLEGLQKAIGEFLE